jgi:CRP/FNR family transcriptional regulator
MTCTASLTSTTGFHTHTGTRCTASDVLRWFGRPDQVSRATDLIEFQMRQVHAGRSLVVEGQPFEKLHLVSSGSFKCVQTDMDGYEQVLAFAIHGDIIGLDGLGQTQHRSGAVALEDASVVTLPIRDLLAMGREVPALESLLHHAAGAEVSRCGDTQYLMAAPSSEVRVARFLLQFARRQSALGHSGRRLRMCMTRRDIASHLGVAHETVSRVLTALDHDGYISVSNRDIELVDLSALQELQRVTRGRQSRERRADTARRATARALVKAAADSATGRFVAGHANAQ